MTADTPKTPQAAEPARTDILLIATGYYTDRLSDTFRVCKPFTFADVLAAYRLELAAIEFTDWLVKNGYIECLPIHNVHVGEYGCTEVASGLLHIKFAPSAAPAEPAQERAAAAQLPVNANWCSTFPKSAAYIINQVAARVDELEAALSARAPAVEPAVFGPLESFAHEVAIGAYEPYELRSAAKRALQASAAAPPVEPAPSEPIVEPEVMAWVSKTVAYTRFLSDARYRKLSPEVQGWYGPYTPLDAPTDAIAIAFAMDVLSRGPNAFVDERSRAYTMLQALRSEPARDEAMERDAARWRDLLAAVMCELPSGSTFSGNAPGHSHNIPGVWDSDNGALSGKSCAWCMTWAAARAALAQAQPGPVVKRDLTTQPEPKGGKP